MGNEEKSRDTLLIDAGRTVSVPRNKKLTAAALHTSRPQF
jgi:hypothetical protein